MTLCDTGPLVAMIDGDDPHHASCAQALEQLPPRPLVTTWAFWVEAMYLLRRAGGLAAQEELWGFLDDDPNQPGEEPFHSLELAHKEALVTECAPRLTAQGRQPTATTVESRMTNAAEPQPKQAQSHDEKDALRSRGLSRKARRASSKM